MLLFPENRMSLSSAIYSKMAMQFRGSPMHNHSSLSHSLVPQNPPPPFYNTLKFSWIEYFRFVMHACACVWWGCSIWVKARSEDWCFPLMHFTEPEACPLAPLPGQQVPGMLLSLLLERWLGCRRALLGLGDLNSVPMLVWPAQHFTD